MSTWQTATTSGAWSGRTTSHYYRKAAFGDGATMSLQVLPVGDCYQWSADIFVPHRPDLIRSASGQIARTPYAAAVAKRKATLAADRLLNRRFLPQVFTGRA